MPNRLIDLTGDRYGSRTVIGRAAVEGVRHAYWHVVCDCGRADIVRGSKLTSGEARQCLDCQARAHRVENPAYVSVHARMRRWLGNAREHTCVACGGTAAEWAYRHDASECRESPEGPYSTNPDDYQPMCVSDHRRMDAKERVA